MLQFLQNQNTCTFSHDKAAPLFIEGDRGPERILRSGKRRQRRKPGDSDGTNAALRSACHHHIGLPVLDRTICLSDGMGSRGTGRHHIDVFSLQSILDPHVSRGHIGDHQRHQKRADPPRSFCQKPFMLTLHGLQASDSRTDAHADPERILLLRRKAGILQRLSRGRHSILAEQLHPLCCPELHSFPRIKMFHLCRQFYLIIRRIKPGNGADPDRSGPDSLPEFLYIISDGRHGAHSGYCHSSAHAFSCSTLPFRRPHKVPGR